RGTGRASPRRVGRGKKVRQQQPLTLANLASALTLRGAFEPAETLLRQARRRQPGDFWFNHNLALTLCEARPARWDEAICFLIAAVALRPSSPGAHYSLGIALKKKGRTDEAIAEYREALRLKKDFPQAHNNLATILQDKGRLDEAIAEYREALRLKKNFPEAYMAHNNLGLVLADKGRLDEA